MTELAKVSDVPPGKGLRVEAGGQEIGLVNLDGQIHAFNPVCLHMGGPLDEGEIENGILVCPWHGWEYDVRSGKCTTTGEPLQCFPVEVKDGVIYLK
jgi:nitrite reductase/ring-hydroxylating ferredoxin subunit